MEHINKYWYYYVLGAIAVATLIIFRKQIFGPCATCGGSPDTKTSNRSNTIKTLKTKASSISSRFTMLTEETNNKLKTIGSDIVIIPEGSKEIPKGLCRCWGIWILWGVWSKKCCADAGRMANNAQEDAILAEFKSKAATIESEIRNLAMETDATLTSSTSKEGEKCICWCVVYLGITVYCHKSSKCCTTAQ